MIKYFLFFVLVSNVASALPRAFQCGLTTDSEARYVKMAQSDFDVLDMVSASKIVRNAFPCDYSVDFQQSYCSYIGESRFSKSCYISSDIGYFFVTFDPLDGAWVIWNRWD